jgi:hypothetical protein
MKACDMITIAERSGSGCRTSRVVDATPTVFVVDEECLARRRLTIPSCLIIDLSTLDVDGLDILVRSEQLPPAVRRWLHQDEPTVEALTCSQAVRGNLVAQRARHAIGHEPIVFERSRPERQMREDSAGPVAHARLCRERRRTQGYSGAHGCDEVPDAEERAQLPATRMRSHEEQAIAIGYTRVG